MSEKARIVAALGEHRLRPLAQIRDEARADLYHYEWPR